jgi:hypothetical protein
MRKPRVNLKVNLGHGMLFLARTIMVVFLLAGLAFGAVPAKPSGVPQSDAAQDPNESDAAQDPNEQPPKRQELLRASLQSFMPVPKPIDLRNATSEYALFLPIAPRMDIQAVRLYLHASNSISLLAPRSQLVVRLGGTVVAQIPLDSRLPKISAVIRLPAELIKPGYNRLSFATAQHYTNECEDPSAPELWTQIDTARSWIAVDGKLRNWEPKLSDLGKIFDPKIWGEHRLTILTPGAITPATLQWGSLAAQAAALRLDYAPLQVRYAPVSIEAAAPAEAALRIDTSVVPSGDGILVGTAAQLAPYLSPALAAQIRDAFLAILPLDAARQRFLIIASGQDDAQVVRALQALGTLNFAYPDAPQAPVLRLDTPKLSSYAGKNMVYPNQSVPFSRLGLPDRTFQGMFDAAELAFSLPPDLYAPEDATVNLWLRFAYGAGLREDSALNIFLNDRFQAAIRLDAPSGGYFQDYKVAIPLSAFKPGTNVIRFESAMMPLVTGKCLAINTQNLQLTLFGQSLIEIPNAAHVTSMPDLTLLARSGFPYTVPPAGAMTEVRVADTDGRTAAAAWTLMGRLAQIQKLPLDGVRFAIGTQDLPAGKDVIVVGSADRIDARIYEQAPLKLGHVSRAPYPVSASPAGPGELSWFARLWRGIKDLFYMGHNSFHLEVAWVDQQGRNLGDHAALMQMQSPAGGGTLTLLTAANPDVLLAQTYRLIGPGVWSTLQGDLVMWKDDTDVAAQRVGPGYTLGNAGLSVRISYIISRHPWLWGIVLGILVLALALLTLRLLMRFKHRRHAGVAEEAPPLGSGS